MFVLSRKQVAAALAALALLASGCITSSAEQDAPPDLATKQPTPEGVFEPPFELVAPTVRIEGDSPFLAGQALRFVATFPASSGVDPAAVRDVLWDFGGDFAVGLQASHDFAVGGLHPVTLTVHDIYDRSAKVDLLVSVAEERVFNDVVAAGTTGADARPRGSGAPHDHVDQLVTIPAGASRILVTLAFNPANLACPQPPVCVPGEANLLVRVYSPSGEKLAEVGSGALPRTLDLAIAKPGDHVIRVSGDKGIDVRYELTTLVLFPGA